MAMTKCSECKADISTEAVACPKCGAKCARRTSPLVMALAVLLIPSCVAGVYISNKASTEAAAALAAAEAAKSPAQRASEATTKAREEADFQQAAAVTRRVKANTKNPASFELVEAVRTNGGALCLEYRGTNSFGAVAPGFAVALPGNDKIWAGSLPDLAATWNKHCAGKTGRNLRHVRQTL